MARPPNRITLRLAGDPADDGYVRLRDLLRELEVFSRVLRETDEALSSDGLPSHYFTVVGLSYSSPAAITFEARPIPNRSGAARTSAAVMAFTYRATREIQSRHRAPTALDAETLQSYRSFGERPKASAVALRQIEYWTRSLDVSPALTIGVDKILGEDEVSTGAVEGMLERVNLHNRANVFHIYPSTGPKKIRCRFPEKMRDRVREAVGRNVAVTGEMRFRGDAWFPHLVDVADVEILPDDRDLPDIADLKGLAPHATRGIPAGEFIEKLRDSWGGE